MSFIFIRSFIKYIVLFCLLDILMIYDIINMYSKSLIQYEYPSLKLVEVFTLVSPLDLEA